MGPKKGGTKANSLANEELDLGGEAPSKNPRLRMKRSYEGRHQEPRRRDPLEKVSWPFGQGIFGSLGGGFLAPWPRTSWMPLVKVFLAP